MAGGVVEDDGDIRLRHDIGVDVVEEAAKLDRAVAFAAGANHRSDRDIERGKQRSGPMPLIIVGPPLGLAGSQRQQRLHAIARLDLTLFIDARHNGAISRVQLETDDIASLLDKALVARQLKGFAAMRL